ncbi:hypothetical protein G5V59_06205 [Nocardioides sp. W3-2-3]|uniref:substrate-binding domain-containing protein n=1 Tax=Nocardioides convexus TaxID=2712224 RepID=UPI0024185D9A|nr:substrate-binding domain-containing protein [Nocardioides convexus]NGZ99970.1 hypothetical protein [Nocardioides convexus]
MPAPSRSPSPATSPSPPVLVPRWPPHRRTSLIKGSGSSWAGNAVAEWVAEVDAKDIKVVYTANGAAQGRKDYANKSSDFGVTDSPYRGKDPSTGAVDSSLGRSFAYLPIVAGGTAFPYNVTVGGKRVKNIRLSGETLARIFTNQITNWNDAAITKDNNGRALPSIPIIPVVRADGAGVTNQFTTWMVSQYPALWKDCNGGRLAATDYFPLNCGEARGQQRAQTGSDGVMNFLKSKGSVGAIAMEEYSYPLAAGYPVAKSAQQGRLLHAADAVQRRGGAHPCADQRRPEGSELPHPEVWTRSTSTRTSGPTRCRRTSTRSSRPPRTTRR